MTPENRTSRGMFLVGAFAAGGVAGWMAHAKSQADSESSSQPWGVPDDTAYPPNDSRDFDEDEEDGDPDVPSPTSPRAPNVDDVLDPEIAAASRHDVTHGTSVADQAWASDPIQRSR